MPADLVFENARIYTVDARQPWAQSVAVKDGQIAAVGSNESVATHVDRKTKRIDLGGRFMLPGFIDAHVHLARGARNLPIIRLRDATTMVEVLERIRNYAQENPNKPWILGAELGHSYPDMGRGFDKSDLDAIAPNRPVFIRSGLAHADWLNSRALELAGINRDTPDPADGEIVRDAGGNPTGLLRESARKLIEPYVPALSEAEMLKCLRSAIGLANRLGITGAQSAGHDDLVLPLLVRLRDEGALTLRLSVAQIIHPPELSDVRFGEIVDMREEFEGDLLAVNSVKFYLDGVIESHTGYMPDGYADQPGLTGLKRWDDDALFSAFRMAQKHGFQVWCHATGPGSVGQALDGFSTDAENSRRLRPRIEHAEVPNVSDIERISRIGAVVGIQPLMIYPKDQCVGMEGIWQRCVGPERLAGAYPIRDILDSGGAVAFGTDWPITDLNPMLGIRNAVMLRSVDGEPEGGWVPAQSISVAEAIHAYTLGAAYGAHRDHNEGSIVVGKFADLIVLSENLLGIDPQDIANTEVQLTMVSGKIVYSNLNI